MSEKKKILVADDAENVKMLLMTSLEMSGYDVTTAGDGLETCEKGKTEQFPTTSVVTPWRSLLSPVPSATRLRSEWVWMSTKPGESTLPAASITVFAATSFGSDPIASMRSPEIPTSAGRAGDPVPSTSLQLRMTRSTMELSGL